VIVGEVGGTQEERASEFIKKGMSKPVIAYIAGRAAPQGVRMGHAGAIVTRGMGSAESKMRALQEAGVRIAERPGAVAKIVTDETIHPVCRVKVGVKRREVK
jgi:succinyl-CoA synthetase alpha subunit